MVIIAILLSSVVFFSVILIVGALMLRGQWEKMGTESPRDRRET